MKHTIFFSHCSADADLVGRLKVMLVEKTSGTVEIFLSSDGQSISLGSNWVHRLQEALDNADLVFVFVTTRSVKSGWLFFEAGHSYAKGKPVIPIGLGEVDVGRISPPLSLLQGFNIKSADGLNNLVAVVNKKFGHNHKESFTELDLQSLFGERALVSNGLLSRYVDAVSEVELQVPREALQRPPQESFRLLVESVQSGDADHTLVEGTLIMAGLSFHATSAPALGLRVDLDPLTSDDALCRAEVLLDPILIKDQFLSLEIRFEAPVVREYSSSRVTARLLNQRIKLAKSFSDSSELAFSWDSMEFQFEDILSTRGNALHRDSVKLIVRTRERPLPTRRIGQLLHALFTKRVLEVVDEGGGLTQR